MIARPSLWRAVLAAVLAAVIVPAATPLAEAAGWTVGARAADPVTIEPAPTLVRRGPRTDRVVALTFDDGWNRATLRRIYQILVREHVPATFFVTGVYVQRAPALWRRIAAAGFPLANHSWLHRDTRDLSPHAVARDLARTREVVEKVTGRAMLPYYRPPYGARNAATDRLAAAAGFPYVILWDTSGADTAAHPTVARVVRNATAGRSGSIILLHAGPVVTPRALPAIIARYRARGFRFVTLPELLGSPRDGSWPTGAPAPAPGPVPSRPGRSSEPAGFSDRFAPEPDLQVGGPVAVSTARGRAVAPREEGEAPPPARPVPTAAPAPRARDAAWARRDGAPPAVAVFTVALLVLLLVGAVVAGRSRRPEDVAAG